jgi:hypothetical protein
MDGEEYYELIDEFMAAVKLRYKQFITFYLYSNIALPSYDLFYPAI